MENWSYKIRELWTLHKREIKRYGFCALLVFAGFTRASYRVAWIGVIIAAVMFCFDRWGRPWAERGKQVLGGNRTQKK
jgi:hypothetical protein